MSDAGRVCGDGVGAMPLPRPGCRFIIGAMFENTQTHESSPARRVEVRSLSGPELSVIYRHGQGDGDEVLRMAVLELILRGVLQLDTPDGSGRQASVRQTGAEVELDRPIAAVAASLGEAEMSLRALEHELSLTWTTADDYLWSEVLPLLRSRDLVRVVERRFPLRWLGTKVELTALGLDARAQLDDLFEALPDHFAGWVDGDPDRAAAWVQQAGVAVLLARRSWSDVRRLQASAGGAVAGGLEFSVLGGRAADVLEAWAGGFGGGESASSFGTTAAYHGYSGGV